MSLIHLFRKQNRKTLFTTPSHGQKFFVFHKFMQFYKHDISETDAHDPVSALHNAENKAAKIYGTKYTKFLTNLLLNHNQNSSIYYINYCQILKRENKLTGENIDKIIDIRNNCDALEIKLGCNLLLDNKTEVNSLLKK